ncbi:hypothetical protein SAMN05518865_110160 [Duganella sp. CF458]|uniref:gp53-like domain-containing protein n=1 Tax=Duganella sp. CF458 TaxID=1884368 RepID=UPI0008EC33BE|nr:hypothetical protein [Duganella sp. CF458]SFG29333.1 hypothetical protein SAMN05518865_110160 [Duganella sp. CF458]
MKRISTSTKSVDKFGAGKHGFTNGNAVAGIPATDLEDSWFDHVQEEICAVIEAGGLALDGTNRAQLLAVLRSSFGSFSGYSNIPASRALTAADIGQALWLGGAGIVLTLPTPASLGVQVGKAVTVFGNAYTGSIAAGAGANINYTSNNDGAITIASGQTATFVAVTGSTWQVVHSTAAMEKNADFAGLIGVNGWRRQPGGKITQEGSGVTDANGKLTITFPTSFINSGVSYKIVAMHSGAGAAIVIEISTSRSLSGTVLQAFSFSGAPLGAGNTIEWIATGY